MGSLNGKSRKELEAMGWEHAGVSSVDSGMVIIGDPCYYTNKGLIPNECAPKDEGDVIQLNHAKGHPGKGVIISGFGGDGQYDVYIQRSSNGGVVSAMIKFYWNDDVQEGEENE